MHVRFMDSSAIQKDLGGVEKGTERKGHGREEGETKVGSIILVDVLGTGY